jgi:hypothetical protein
VDIPYTHQNKKARGDGVKTCRLARAHTDVLIKAHSTLLVVCSSSAQTQLISTIRPGVLIISHCTFSQRDVKALLPCIISSFPFWLSAPLLSCVFYVFALERVCEKAKAQGELKWRTYLECHLGLVGCDDRDIYHAGHHCRGQGTNQSCYQPAFSVSTRATVSSNRNRNRNRAMNGTGTRGEAAAQIHSALANRMTQRQRRPHRTAGQRCTTPTTEQEIKELAPSSSSSTSTMESAHGNHEAATASKDKVE